MKDFSQIIEQQNKDTPKTQVNANIQQPQQIKDNFWSNAKNRLIKISGPFVISVFTGPLNTASMLLQMSEKPSSDAFVRKIQAAGTSSNIVRTGILGDNKIYLPFQFKGYNDCLSQLGRQGVRGLYKGTLTGVIMSLINTKIRLKLYDQLNKFANFSQQWKSNILTILTCTVADIITLPIMFCQSRLVLQNSLTNFRTYNGFTDVLRNCRPVQLFSGMSLLVFKNIIFSYSWISYFKNSAAQSFILSTILSHVLMYPFVTVIRQMQTNAMNVPMMNQRKENIRECATRIYKTMGIRGFYRGFVAYAMVHSFLSFIMIDMNMRSGYFSQSLA